MVFSGLVYVCVCGIGRVCSTHSVVDCKGGDLHGYRYDIDSGVEQRGLELCIKVHKLLLPEKKQHTEL